MRDIVTQIETQEQMFRQMNNPAQADKMKSWATYIKGLRAEVEALTKHTVHIYNAGYTQGHNDTVEGQYVDIVSSDMNSYHDDIVTNLIAELKDMP